MIVLCGEISRNSNRSSRSHNNNHNRDVIMFAIKAVVRKSILTQIAKVRAANSFH
jgi:hypothetical protein